MLLELLPLLASQISFNSNKYVKGIKVPSLVTCHFLKIIDRMKLFFKINART